MAFDAKSFISTRFTVRTLDVPVPDMAQFFAEGDKPVWTVKGLTGQEIGQVKEQAAQNKNVGALLEALQSENNEVKIEALKESLGLSDKVPQDIADRLYRLCAGSIEPKCDMELALRICERFPVEFFNITTEIMKLTGEGMTPGKPQPSTQTPASEPV